MNTRSIACLMVLMLSWPEIGQADHSPFLEQARGVKAAEGNRLVKLARQTLVGAVERGELDPTIEPREKPSVAPFGVFVTLVKNGHVRGCYGSMEPRGKTLDELVVEGAIGAARFDPRTRPLGPAELHQVQIIVSIVGPRVPVLTMTEVDPKTHGLLVRNGDRTSVLLPGEAKTASWQLKRSLRQAGIRRGDPREMFRFRTVTIYERVGGEGK
ncbi:MAG: AMMECR1 domain-containing protein [Myxococcota bacterium]|jgi:AMMECR1 domain-containing protein